MNRSSKEPVPDELAGSALCALGELLTRLEEISAETVRLSDPAGGDAVDIFAAQALIRERGTLIDQLKTALSPAAGLLTHEEFNRLVVIHFQGARAQSNITEHKNRLAGLLSTNARSRALLDRITGIFETPRVRSLDNTA